MKRLFFVLLLCCFLASCTKPLPYNLEPVISSYRCEYLAYSGDFESRGRVVVSGGEILEFFVDTPQNICGLSVVLDGFSANIDYDDTCFEIDLSALPPTALPILIHDTLLSLKRECDITKNSSNVFCCSGTISGGNYYAEFRPDGFLNKLCVGEISIVFDNFEYCKS